jgi:hypothetical protein
MDEDERENEGEADEIEQEEEEEMTVDQPSDERDAKARRLEKGKGRLPEVRQALFALKEQARQVGLKVEHGTDAFMLVRKASSVPLVRAFFTLCPLLQYKSRHS